jgi:hypothetical protein
MLQRLIPRRWRRRIRRQGYQGAEIVEVLLLELQGALGRYRRNEISEAELSDSVLEASLATVARLLLDGPS